VEVIASLFPDSSYIAVDICFGNQFRCRPVHETLQHSVVPFEGKKILSS
jgi:hypothetical protein